MISKSGKIAKRDSEQRNDNLLPVFCHRIGSFVEDVAGVEHACRSGESVHHCARVHVVGAVVRHATDDTRRSVPVVVTVRPRQHGRKRRKQVAQGPRQDHIVVDVQQEHDHCRRKPDAWVKESIYKETVGKV